MMSWGEIFCAVYVQNKKEKKNDNLSSGGITFSYPISANMFFFQSNII